MLFKSQFKQVVSHLDGETLLFLGTTKYPMEGGEKFISVTGVKLDNKKVRAEVIYHYPLHPGMVTETAFRNDLEPAMFERFLNDFATEVSKNDVGNKLVELDLSHLSMDDLSMLNEEQAWQLYLIFLSASGEAGNTRSGFSTVRDYVDKLRSGAMTPGDMPNAIQYEVQRLKTSREDGGI